MLHITPMRRCLLFLSGFCGLLSLTTAPAPARADIVLEGYKNIIHTIRVEGLREYAARYQFYSVSMPHSKITPTADRPKPWAEVHYTLLKGDGEINAKNVSPKRSASPAVGDAASRLRLR